MTYLEERNIKRFRALLEQEGDPAKRRVLEDLLAKEQGKLRASRTAPSPARPPLPQR